MNKITLVCNSCKKKILFTDRNMADFENRVKKAGGNKDKFMAEFVCRPCKSGATKVEKPAKKAVKEKLEKKQAKPRIVGTIVETPNVVNVNKAAMAKYVLHNIQSDTDVQAGDTLYNPKTGFVFQVQSTDDDNVTGNHFQYRESVNLYNIAENGWQKVENFDVNDTTIVPF